MHIEHAHESCNTYMRIVWIVSYCMNRMIHRHLCLNWVFTKKITWNWVQQVVGLGLPQNYWAIWLSPIQINIHEFFFLLLHTSWKMSPCLVLNGWTFKIVLKWVRKDVAEKERDVYFIWKCKFLFYTMNKMLHDIFFRTRFGYNPLCGNL